MSAALALTGMLTRDGFFSSAMANEAKKPAFANPMAAKPPMIPAKAMRAMPAMEAKSSRSENSAIPHRTAKAR